MSATRVRLLCNRAISQAEYQCFDDARASVEEAARLAGDGEELKGLVETARCRLAYLLRDLDGAASHGAEATRLLEQHGAADDAARAVIYMGSVKGAGGRYLEALNLFNKALDLLRRSADRRLLVLARWGLGSALCFLERYREARDCLLVAEDKAEEALSLVERGNLQRSLGVACLHCGEYEPSMSMLDRALHAFETVGRVDLIADVLNSIGSLHTSLGDRSAARSSFERALAVLDRRPTVEVAEAFYELSRLEIMEGHPAEAVKHAEAALSVANTLGSATEIGRSLLALGQALLSLEQYEAALPALRRAYDILKEKGLALSVVVAEDMLKYAERRCQSCGGLDPCPR